MCRFDRYEHFTLCIYESSAIAPGHQKWTNSRELTEACVGPSWLIRRQHRYGQLMTSPRVVTGNCGRCRHPIRLQLVSSKPILKNHPLITMHGQKTATNIFIFMLTRFYPRGLPCCLTTFLKAGWHFWKVSPQCERLHLVTKSLPNVNSQ